MVNQRTEEDFFAHTHELLEYYVDTKMAEVSNEQLQAILKTETGRQALKELLLDFGTAYTFSALVYIDGVEGTLHEGYATFGKRKK
jgi:hypothetical protein